MGLALCHSIPRDVVVQVALLLLFVTIVLQAAAIGLHGSDDAAGFFTVKGSGSSLSAAVALVAAHPATYAGPGSTLSSGGARVKICDPSAAMLSNACGRFAEAFHAVNGLTVSSFVTGVVAVAMGIFVVSRVCTTTLGLLFRLGCIACVPAVLQCAAVGVFFAHVVPHARRDTARVGGWAAGDLTFHRRPAAGLMAAATALACAALVLLFVRWIVVLCVRRQFEKRPEQTAAEVERVTAAHMVNDDWLRQQQILLSHAHSVKVEMAVKRSPPGGDWLGSSVNGQREPYHQPLTESAVDPRQTSSAVDDDEDTLHFHFSGGRQSGTRSAGAVDDDATTHKTGSTPPPALPLPNGAPSAGSGGAREAQADAPTFSDADTR